MLPRLHAEEAVATAERTAMGSGTMDRDQARAVSGRWARAVHGNRAPVAATPQALAAIGIGDRRQVAKESRTP